MLSILENPAVRARVPALSVANYHRLYECGSLQPDVELIRGAIIEKMPKSPLHTSIVLLLSEHLRVHLLPGMHVRPEQPFSLPDSEPEPDIVIVKGDRSAYFKTHPTSALLIVEVAISSEALDRLKLELYAEAGVPESWLVFPEARAVERYTQPVAGAYTHVECATLPQELESTVLPGLRMLPQGIFEVL